MTVNLEAGLPTVSQARVRLMSELQKARNAGVRVLKLIHGYGSSGVGGDLRIALQSSLRQMVEHKEIQDCVFGEDWCKGDERAWVIVKRFPELKEDRDFGRKNKGITIVVL
jgi:DNA-nicking Smr family endonuclease